MPDVLIQLSEEEWALLDSLGACEGLSVDEAALNVIRERLRDLQEQACDVDLGLDS